MKIDLHAFHKEVEKKNLTVNSRPEDRLFLWNYTDHCVYGKHWNNTTKMARGLITTFDGEVVARPFPKFFNFEEHGPSHNFAPVKRITRKLDGSLGIAYPSKCGWRIATRGAFDSEQAGVGTGLLERYSSYKFNPEWTYLFEIIYPENRVVVDYRKARKLVLLAIRETGTGRYINLNNVKVPFEVVKSIEVTEKNAKKVFPFLKEQNLVNEEGFVIQLENDELVKVKFAEYIQLHRIKFGLNTKVVWEMLRDGKDLEEIKLKAPDEVAVWICEVEEGLREEYALKETQAKQVVRKAKKLKMRKEQAKLITGEAPIVAGICFAMLDGKDYDEIIWKLIKPKQAEFFK